MFQMGGKFGAVSFLQIVAPELSDRMLADFMDADVYKRQVLRRMGLPVALCLPDKRVDLFLFLPRKFTLFVLGLSLFL